MPKRVAMLVSNPCNPDYRVVKEATSLAENGYEVCVFGTWRPHLGIPIREVVNGVTYIRYEWNVIKMLRIMYLGDRQYRQIPKMNREPHHKKVGEIIGRDRGDDQ